MKVLAYIFSIIIFVLIILAVKGYEYILDKNIRNKIRHLLLENNLDTLWHINQSCDITETQYLITGESEHKIATDIMQAFKDELKNDYIKENYIVNRKYVKMTEYEYFSYYFAFYLKEHNGYCFGKNTMYSEVSRDYYNDIYYKVNCTLTDYGVIYNKLYYLIILFCEKSDYLNKNRDYNSNSIKNEIDSKQATFCNYLN